VKNMYSGISKGEQMEGKHRDWMGSGWGASLVTAVLLSAMPSAEAEVTEKYVSPDKTFSVSIDGDALVYRGLLLADGVDRAEKYLSDHPSLTVLAIASGGGDIEAGMKLGDLVLARAMDVRVFQFCGSSCANYVFVSGRRKIIEPGAVVMWHGSPLRPENIAVNATVVDTAGKSTTTHYEGEALLEYLKRPNIAPGIESDRQRQLEFFERRKVDGRVTVHGHEIGCQCQWTFTLDDMQRFGIKDVQPDSSYPWPASLEAENTTLLRIEHAAAEDPGFQD